MTRPLIVASVALALMAGAVGTLLWGMRGIW